MLVNTVSYEDPAEAFSTCELSLDITIEASCSREAISFCTEVFSRTSASLKSMSQIRQGVITIKAACGKYTDIETLNTALAVSDAPKVLNFTTSIGRRKPRPTASCQ